MLFLVLAAGVAGWYLHAEWVARCTRLGHFCPGNRTTCLRCGAAREGDF